MLTANNTYVRSRFLGGALKGVTIGIRGFVANAQAFGKTVSIPQGYNDPARALVPTLATGGNISARFPGESALVADLTATGNMAASLDGEASLTAAGNVLSNGYATFAADSTFTAGIKATGNMSAAMDILARPSAFDIAQEVWNGAATGYTGTGTMGKELQDAKKAAKLAAALSA